MKPVELVFDLKTVDGQRTINASAYYIFINIFSMLKITIMLTGLCFAA